MYKIDLDDRLKDEIVLFRNTGDFLQFIELIDPSRKAIRRTAVPEAPTRRKSDPAAAGTKPLLDRAALIRDVSDELTIRKQISDSGTMIAINLARECQAKENILFREKFREELKSEAFKQEPQISSASAAAAASAQMQGSAPAGTVQATSHVGFPAGNRIVQSYLEVARIQADIGTGPKGRDPDGFTVVQPKRPTVTRGGKGGGMPRQNPTGSQPQGKTQPNRSNNTSSRGRGK